MSARVFAAIIVVAASGCRMCSDSGDYSPPVAGSPYNGMNRRAGSVFNGDSPGSVVAPPQELPQTSPAPIEPQIAP